MFIPNNSTVSKLQTAEDLQGDVLLHYDAEMELMNLILPGSTCFSLQSFCSVNERFGKKRHAFSNCTINTKFLNSLQPEWLKYVTQVRLAKHLTVDTFDDLFDLSQQYEKLVNVSRAKKLEKYHDPLALIAHTGSSSRNTSSYYVTHPTSVVDYEDEYQQDDEVEIKELSTNICLMARIQPADNTFDVGPSHDSAFISEIFEGQTLKKNVDLNFENLAIPYKECLMLGPMPLSVYDQQLKHGLGYLNPYTLKQAISQCPKLYLASSLGTSAEQQYFPSSFIPSEKNSNATPSIPLKTETALANVDKESWLWHHRLSHLNFGTINDLTRLDLVDGLPKFKYGKDHLCSACERGKSKKASHPLKLIASDHSKLELLHMDLCAPIRVASINGKKYIL
ncbi:integrase, catalytic region, zinc finger, CCHC-type containing protein [Tanacetum coccineum]|uniref:Integrase, catalytic region, zinc finger, CCHC-type containing protein n=1 Tax=Tanacetum coccineum TaxID=301880 RepID=A0ABQ4YE46_9ASTR